MSTVTIVFVAIWNALLVVGFTLVLVFRKKEMRWVTGADEDRGNRTDVDDAWTAFLADHPELR